MAPRKKPKTSTRLSAAAKRKKAAIAADNNSSSDDDFSDEHTTTTTITKISTERVRVKYNSPISSKEKQTYGNGKYKNYLFEDKWSSMSMFTKGVIINFVIEDFHKECFPENDRREWNEIYNAATKEFDLNWSWEQHNKYKLNCETFQPVMETIEFHLLFTPHMTNIRQPYLVCKQSTIAGAGYGMFCEIPLRKDQMIGCLFGREHVQRNYVYDMANKLITGYDFESKYGKLNAGCGMNTKLHSGNKPHPMYGMHMLNDHGFPRLRAGWRAKADRKSLAYFNYDLSVRMRQGVRPRTEITLFYNSNNQDE